MIYLDNAATTFPKPETVYREMDRANREFAVNAGRGSYKAARTATNVIDETKKKLLQLFHAEGIADICFTPSITHAINQVLAGTCLDESSNVYITPYEHNAVARTIKLLQQKLHFSVMILPTNDDLTIDMERTRYEFTRNKPTLVVVNKVSNVTGYVLPAEEIFSMAKEFGAITIMDAAQAAGLCNLDMSSNNTDVLCFAGHKTLYGPFGIGGFALKHGVPLEPVFAGGTGSNSLNLDMPLSAPERFEAASQNIVAVAGLRASLAALDQESHFNHSLEMTRYLLQQLRTIDKIKMMGAYEPGETLGIVSFVMEDYTSNDIGTILDDEFDIAVRTGFHCAPYIHDYLGDKEFGGTVRIGIGLFTTKDDIDYLIKALKTL